MYGQRPKVHPLIEAEKAEGGDVAKACALMGLSQSAYYEWSKQRPSRRQLADGEIQDVFDASRTCWPGPLTSSPTKRPPCA